MIYLVLTVLLIGLYTIKRRSLMNVGFLFAAPYVFIIFLNNAVMVNKGYYTIKPPTFRTLLLFTIGLIVGAVFQSLIEKRVSIKNISFDLDEAINEYSIRKLKHFLWLIIIIRIISILFSISRVGIDRLYADDFEQLQLTGIVGHLILLGTTLVPFIYKDYLKSKNKGDLITTLAFIGTLFLSFIKYQVIILVIVLFFEYCFYCPQKIIKAFALLFGVTIALFLGNYWISFYLRDISFNSTFAVSKVWTYVAGGTISNDVILETEQNSYSFGAWLLTIPSGIVNLFSTVLVGKPLIENIGWGHVTVGQTTFQSYWTNVFSILTYITQCSTIVEKMLISIIVGCVGEAVIPLHDASNEKYTKPTRLFLLSFVFLNFFSNYFCLSSSWEMIGWSLLSPIIIRSLPYLSFKRIREKI